MRWASRLSPLPPPKGFAGLCVGSAKLPKLPPTPEPVMPVGAGWDVDGGQRLLNPPGDGDVVPRRSELKDGLDCGTSLEGSGLSSASSLSLPRRSAALRANQGEPSSRVKRLPAVVGDETPAAKGLRSIDSRRRVPGLAEVGDVRLYGFPLPCETEVFRPLGPVAWAPSLFCGGGFIGELTSSWNTCRNG